MDDGSVNQLICLRSFTHHAYGAPKRLLMQFNIATRLRYPYRLLKTECLTALRYAIRTDYTLIPNIPATRRPATLDLVLTCVLYVCSMPLAYPIEAWSFLWMVDHCFEEEFVFHPFANVLRHLLAYSTKQGMARAAHHDSRKKIRGRNFTVSCELCSAIFLCKCTILRVVLTSGAA